jgi:hypothetical protein
MAEKHYTLKTIFDSLMYAKNGVVNKRLILDKSPLGGIGSKWIMLGFIILPFAIYISIFNSTSFAYLGIAQAIVFYIILLVFAMQVIVGISYYNNKKVIKMVTPSWESYFPTIDIKMILSSGVTPYVDFKKYYAVLLAEALDDETLYSKLQDAFKNMEEDNADLLAAMNNCRSKK